ncbi:hypothetical protein HY637_03615 [Candidatus Woesearchaeota archaeon]|nr:hypothetical protein [Candidatus Woesearchaeota archaeon]
MPEPIHESAAWNSLNSNQQVTLRELFSDEQIHILLLHLVELGQFHFFISIGTTVTSKDTIIENIIAYQSQTKLSDFEILRLKEKKRSMGYEDRYRLPEVIKEFEEKQQEMEEFLKRYNVTRVIVPFKEPIKLYNYEEIVKEAKHNLKDKFGEKHANSIASELDSFLRKEMLGVPPFQNKQIIWSGPVSAHLGAYFVHAVEFWLILSREIYMGILIGIFGFTDEKHTRISGEDILFYKGERTPLSAAFTFHKGFGIPISMFYDYLGRNMLGNYKSEVEGWFKAANQYGIGMYRYEATQVYSATPFSIPADVIFYPHEEEFGVPTTNTFFNIKYLRPSLRAKVMIKLYFEKITGRKFTIHKSTTINYINHIESQ